MDNVFSECLEEFEGCFKSVNAIFQKSSTIFISGFLHTKILKRKLRYVSGRNDFYHFLKFRLRDIQIPSDTFLVSITFNDDYSSVLGTDNLFLKMCLTLQRHDLILSK